MTATSTSAGAVLLRAVLPQLAVVLLSLPFKSCGWDLTAVPSRQLPAAQELVGASQPDVAHQRARGLAERFQWPSLLSITERQGVEVFFWRVDQLGVVVSLPEGSVRVLLHVEAVCYLLSFTASPHQR